MTVIPADELPGLTLEQKFALVREIDAVSTLLRHGFAIMPNYRFASRDAEALFVCWAGGAEKLLKLTVGLVAYDEGEAWPNLATMKGAGHKITELDDAARKLINLRASQSTVPGHIEALLERTDGHSGVVQILSTLERYAVKGRFFNLDLLAGQMQAGERPLDLWEELHQMILEANPDMMEDLAGESWEDARQELNKIIAWSMALWCELLRSAWATGVCGALARMQSPSLDLGHDQFLPAHG